MYNIFIHNHGSLYERGVLKSVVLTHYLKSNQMTKNQIIFFLAKERFLLDPDNFQHLFIQNIHSWEPIFSRLYREGDLTQCCEACDKILHFHFTFRHTERINMAVCNLIDERKRHTMCMALAASHNDSKIANFLKLTRWTGEMTGISA